MALSHRPGSPHAVVCRRDDPGPGRLRLRRVRLRQPQQPAGPRSAAPKRLSVGCGDGRCRCRWPRIPPDEPSLVTGEEELPWVQMWTGDGKLLLFQNDEAQRRRVPRSAKLNGLPDDDRGCSIPSRCRDGAPMRLLAHRLRFATIVHSAGRAIRDCDAGGSSGSSPRSSCSDSRSPWPWPASAATCWPARARPHRKDDRARATLPRAAGRPAARAQP